MPPEIASALIVPRLRRDRVLSQEAVYTEFASNRAGGGRKSRGGGRERSTRRRLAQRDSLTPAQRATIVAQLGSVSRVPIQRQWIQKRSRSNDTHHEPVADGPRARGGPVRRPKYDAAHHGHVGLAAHDRSEPASGDRSHARHVGATDSLLTAGAWLKSDLLSRGTIGEGYQRNDCVSR